MTPIEIVDRIQGILDGQPSLGQLHDELDKFQNELLGDPSGNLLQSIEYERTAKFWDNDKRDIAPAQALYFRQLALEYFLKANTP